MEDKEGCQAVFAREDSQKHETNCEYLVTIIYLLTVLCFAPIFCKYSVTCGKIRKRELEQHEKICAFRPLECPHCKLLVEFNQLDVRKI